MLASLASATGSVPLVVIRLCTVNNFDPKFASLHSCSLWCTRERRAPAITAKSSDVEKRTITKTWPNFNFFFFKKKRGKKGKKKRKKEIAQRGARTHDLEMISCKSLTLFQLS